MKRKRILNGVIKYVVLIIILVFLLFPLLWVLLTSFKTNMEAYKFPSDLYRKESHLPELYQSVYSG